MTSIGWGAFSGCSSLANIEVAENNPNYSSENGVLYNKNKTVLIRYAIGKSDTEFIIPGSVTNIGKHAFEDCSSLTSVSIPEGVTSIGDDAFSRCSSLTSVSIPSSVTSIGDYAFWDCSSLADIYYGGTEEEWKRIYRDYELTTATIHYNSSDVPSAKVKITAFTVTKTDSCRIAELSAENIPEGAVVYIAAYTADGKVAEIRKSVPENGNVRAQFPLGGTYKFKAYIWDNSYRPLCEGKTVSELAEAPATETDITETSVCVNANNVKAGSTIIVASYKAGL